MNSGTLHAAGPDEREALWPAVEAARLFDSRERFERFCAEVPWRVQVTARGEAVVAEEWRSHLDVLALRGLWASSDRVPALVGQIGRIAAEHGFGRILSPLVASDAAPVYERAGLSVHGTVVALCLDRATRSRGEIRTPPGVRMRPGEVDDLPRLVAIDAECFDGFWRSAAARLARHFAEDRIVVAEGPEGVIGYTLATVIRQSGTLGRLAVAPAARRLGIGEALLREALGHLVETGAGTVSLCTQEENVASRGLYRKVGLTELTGRLVFLIGAAGARPRRLG